MNIKGLFVGTFTLVSLATLGCQPATPDQIRKARNAMGYQSDQPKIAITTTSVLGNWLSACALDPEKDALFRRDLLKISPSDFTFVTSYYSDSKCELLSYEQDLSGFYQITDTSISISFLNASVTPATTLIAASFNQFDGYCKVKDWQVGIPRFFSDLSSCGFSPALTTKIARYGKNELFWGSQRFELGN